VFSSHGNTKDACWKYVGFLYANEQCESPIDSSRIFCRVCLDEQKTGGFHLSKVANFSLGTSTVSHSAVCPRSAGVRGVVVHCFARVSLSVN
jgi:hypothetical protein